ncbi:hypothetical protein [Hyphobacterium sp.]|uniref:hypothetical protein n=1 Tax=Hyphobacterium sp. TaxID=2004662 RepID=UPI003BA9862C
MRMLKRLFAGLISAGLFVFLVFFCTQFLEPQGQNGWIAAIILLGVSAIGCVLLYAWILGPKSLRSREAGDDNDPGAIGLGLTGVGLAGDRRRRDDSEPDDLGGRRRDTNDDTDGDLGAIG